MTLPADADRARRKLDIAMFTYGLPVPGAQRGGIERVAHELAQGLAERGHRVIVWTHDPRPQDAQYEVRELPWRRFVGTWLGRRMTMGFLGNILALLPRYGAAEVIVAHGDSLLLPLRRRPVVRIMHGSALEEALSASSPWRFGLQLCVYLQEIATALLQSNCVADSKNTRRFNPWVRRVIPLGVDLRRFRPGGESVKTESPSLLFVGALSGRKRGRLLLDWFHRDLKRRVPRATLTVVGPPGPSLPGVSYHTGVGDAELVALYQRSWVYASPSKYEGFGLPYLEAMASGTPVVATPNPGSREVLGEGRFGVLAADAFFADALVHLLESDESRQRWRLLGLQRAEELTLTRMIDGYESLLLHLGEAT